MYSMRSWYIIIFHTFDWLSVSFQSAPPSRSVSGHPESPLGPQRTSPLASPAPPATSRRTIFGSGKMNFQRKCQDKISHFKRSSVWKKHWLFWRKKISNGLIRKSLDLDPDNICEWTKKKKRTIGVELPTTALPKNCRTWIVDLLEQKYRHLIARFSEKLHPPLYLKNWSEPLSFYVCCVGQNSVCFFRLKTWLKKTTRPTRMRSVCFISSPGEFQQDMPARLSTPNTAPRRFPGPINGECCAKCFNIVVVETVRR